MAIKLTYEKQDYQLEYTRESVKTMEQTGFSFDEIDSKPATMIPMLFYGAFIAKHRGIKRKLVDKIYDNTPNKTELIGVLGEMYAETLSYLTESSDEGNVKWEVM